MTTYKEFRILRENKGIVEASVIRVTKNWLTITYQEIIVIGGKYAFHEKETGEVINLRGHYKVAKALQLLEKN